MSNREELVDTIMSMQADNPPAFEAMRTTVAVLARRQKGGRLRTVETELATMAMGGHVDPQQFIALAARARSERKPTRKRAARRPIVRAVPARART